jgi:hypothetical protein
MLGSIYKKDVIVFNNLKVKNEIHSSYPQEWIVGETERYVLNNLVDHTQSIDLNWDNKSHKEITAANTEPAPKAYDVKELLSAIYKNLLTNGVVTQLDINIMDKWMTYF